MPTLNCPKCKSPFSVPETSGGFKTACPSCKASITIKAKEKPVAGQPIFAVKVDDPPIVTEVPVTHPVARFVPPAPAPMVLASPPEPIIHSLQEVACQGCAKPIATLMECTDCRAAFCSEVCLERHFRLTRHGTHAAPMVAPITMHAPPTQQVINVVVQNESTAHSHHTHVRPPRPFPHGAHLFLTLISCGLWLPIWIIAAACHEE